MKEIVMVLVILLVLGCATNHKPINHTSVMCVVIHVVDRIEDIPCGANGCSKENEIWILGSWWNEIITLDYYVLGREIAHEMGYYNDIRFNHR